MVGRGHTFFTPTLLAREGEGAALVGALRRLCFEKMLAASASLRLRSRPVAC